MEIIKVGVSPLSNQGPDTGAGCTCYQGKIDICRIHVPCVVHW